MYFRYETITQFSIFRGLKMSQGEAELHVYLPQTKKGLLDHRQEYIEISENHGEVCLEFTEPSSEIGTYSL